MAGRTVFVGADAAPHVSSPDTATVMVAVIQSSSGRTLEKPVMEAS
jgi:hypothetical protein